MVQAATITNSDSLSGVVLSSFTVTAVSNEPENGLGDGDTAPDVAISGGSVQLRAERAGTGTGRVYSVIASVQDVAGNAASGTGTCTVLHDLASVFSIGLITDAGTAKSVVASLDNASKLLGVNDRAAKAVLSALLSKLDAFAKGGQISPAVRDTLAAQITTVISALP